MENQDPAPKKPKGHQRVTKHAMMQDMWEQHQDKMADQLKIAKARAKWPAELKLRAPVIAGSFFGWKLKLFKNFSLLGMTNDDQLREVDQWTTRLHCGICNRQGHHWKCPKLAAITPLVKKQIEVAKKRAQDKKVQSA